MTVRAKNRTLAALAAKRPHPAPVYTQDEQRDRRRNGLSVTLSGEWSLSQEVVAICDPLGQCIAAAPNPARFRLTREVSSQAHLVNHPQGFLIGVDEVAVTIHGLVHVVVGLLAERDAQRKTAHLTGDVRARSIRSVIDLTPRPELPEITPDDLVSGTWPARLTALAEPYTAPLSGLLGSAPTPTASDRMRGALRDVDRAALSLARRLDRDKANRADRAATTAKPKPSTQTEAARRAELAALGVEI